MTPKDWILLFVPIFCNGVILFVLQKIFEKRQSIMLIKKEYASELRKKIDIALQDHAFAVRLNNEVNPENDEKVQKALLSFFNDSLDVYYYYAQNNVLFKSLETNMNKLSELLKNISGPQKIDDKFCSVLNSIRDILMDMKNKCIKL